MGYMGSLLPFSKNMAFPSGSERVKVYSKIESQVFLFFQTTLKIEAAPMMPMGAMPMAAAAPAQVSPYCA